VDDYLNGGRLQIKTGSANRGEGITKYSRLLEIEAELGKAAVFIICVGIAGSVSASANQGPRDWSAPRLLGAIEGRQESLSANGDARRPDVLSERRMGAPMSGSMSGERKRGVAAWPKKQRQSSRTEERRVGKD
jgi:hypothetical protein